MGPSLSEQRKHSQTPFPQRYHIRTSLVGKFLIYAVIFLFFFLLWYRQGFNIQMPLDPAMYPQISSLFPVGLHPSARQQIILTRSWSKGSALSVDRQQTRSHRKYQIRHSLCIVLLHSLCVCWCLEAPRFFRWIFFFFSSSFLLFGIPGEISKHSQSVPHVLSCVPCFPFSRHAAASESVQSRSTLSGNEQAAALSSNQDRSKKK